MNTRREAGEDLETGPRGPADGGAVRLPQSPDSCQHQDLRGCAEAQMAGTPPQYLRFWGLGGTQDGHPNRLLLVPRPPSEKTSCTPTLLSDSPAGCLCPRHTAAEVVNCAPDGCWRQGPGPQRPPSPAVQRGHLLPTNSTWPQRSQQLPTPPPLQWLSRTGREPWALALTDWPPAGGRGRRRALTASAAGCLDRGAGTTPCQAWPAPLGCLSQGQPEHEGLGRPQTAKA